MHLCAPTELKCGPVSENWHLYITLISLKTFIFLFAVFLYMYIYVLLCRIVMHESNEILHQAAVLLCIFHS